MGVKLISAPIYSYQSVDGVTGSEWSGGPGSGGPGSGGPGVGHRMTADDVRMQQQVIIAGRCGGGRSHEW